MAEELNDCPSCKRPFRNLFDYPIILPLKISITKPENIPDVVPLKGEEEKIFVCDLLKSKRKGERLENDLSSALEHFENPPTKGGIKEKERLVLDKYIYEGRGLICEHGGIPDGNDIEKRPSYPERIYRTLNVAPKIKELLKEGGSLAQYVAQDLNKMVDKEIETSKLKSMLWQDGSLQLWVFEECCAAAITKGINFRVAPLWLYNFKKDKLNREEYNQILSVGYIKYKGMVYPLTKQ